jgi:hypothetical protein
MQSTWLLIPHLDSGGNDIGPLGQGKSIEEMKVLASTTPDCVGFNSNGWFKRELKPFEQWSRWTEDPSKGFYVRDQWLFIPHLDSGGNDIGSLGQGKSIEEMKVLASTTPDCVGFNSNGWFKRELKPFEQWSRWTEDPSKGFYVRDEWEFIPHLDSGGNDIGSLGQGKSIEEMKVLATTIPDCVGFNSNGWFKHTLLPENQWYRWTEDPSKGFYVRRRSDA